METTTDFMGGVVADTFGQSGSVDGISTEFSMDQCSSTQIPRSGRGDQKVMAKRVEDQGRPKKERREKKRAEAMQEF